MANNHNTSEVPSHLRKYRKLEYDFLNAEDVESEHISVNVSNDGKVHDDELLSFVSVYFSNEQMSRECKSNIVSNPEINRKGARITWMENLETGDLIPVARRVTVNADESKEFYHTDGEEGQQDNQVTNGLDTHDMSPLLSIPVPATLVESAEEDSRHLMQVTEQQEVVATISAYSNMVVLQRGIFLVFQGVLAGFAFTTLYVRQSANGDDAQLLKVYQPNAEEFRRYFYILCTLSLVGSVDGLLTIVKSRDSDSHTHGGMHGSVYHRTHSMMRIHFDMFSFLLALAVAALHAVTFICTLLMTDQDVRIYTKNGWQGSDSDWVAAALSNETFSEGLESWKGLDTARLACAVLAWLGCCVFVWNGLTQMNAKAADLFRLSELTSLWRQRADALQGEGLDKMSSAELRQLICIQQAGMERAKTALSYSESNNKETS